MYTSGTTGRPKGVLHSHNSFHADSIKMKPAMHLKDEDVIFCPSPVTHISGYLWALNMPWCGDMPAVLLDVWNAEHALDRKSVVWGKSVSVRVDLGGRRIIKKKKNWNETSSLDLTTIYTKQH